MTGLPSSGRSARRRTLTDREVRDRLYPAGDVKATPMLAPITVRASALHLLREHDRLTVQREAPAARRTLRGVTHRGDVDEQHTA